MPFLGHPGAGHSNPGILFAWLLACDPRLGARTKVLGQLRAGTLGFVFSKDNSENV